MTIDFAADGWSASGCGTDAAALKALADELGAEHLTHACDVTDPAAVEEFATAVTKRFGAPDLLLNNAATINPNKPLWDVSANEFSRVIDVNLKGVHLIIRPFLPGMIRRGKGVVANFSSGWGRSSHSQIALKLVLRTNREQTVAPGARLAFIAVRSTWNFTTRLLTP